MQILSSMPRHEATGGKESIPRWLLYAAIGLVYVVWLLTLSSGHNWGGDFGQYIHHAKNLVEGKPYADIGYIHNVFAFVGPDAYPPVYPATLAPVYWLYGLDWFVLKMVPVTAFALALVFLLLLVGKKLGTGYQLVLLLVISLSPFFWQLKDKIISDYLFFMLCMLTLYVLTNRYTRQASTYIDSKNRSWSFAVALGLLLYLCYETREIGIVFIPAILCFELFHFRKISLVSCAALLVFAAAVGLQNNYLSMTATADTGIQSRLTELASEQGMTRSHVDHLDFINIDIVKIAKQTARYVAEVRGIWPQTDNILVQAASWVAFVLVLLFALAGYIRSLLSGPDIQDIFVAGFIAILVLFGGFQGLRYVVPLIPLFFVYAFQLHKHLMVSGYRKSMTVLAATFLAATTVSYAASYPSYSNRETLAGGITSPDAVALFDYVKNSTPQDSVLLFRKPRVVCLLTGRSSSGLPGNRGTDFVVRYMRAIGAEYLVQSNIDWRGYSHPLESTGLSDERFSLEYNNSSFYVYRLKPG